MCHINCLLFSRFDGCSAVELGGGVGLCSIVLSRVARRVICTGAHSYAVSTLDWKQGLISYLKAP